MRLTGLRLTSLRRYPVKGLRGEDHAAMEIDPCGPSGDRRWMAVQPDGVFMSQRRWPGMARIAATLQGDGALVLSCDGASIRVPVPDGAARLRVTVWRSELDAALAGRVADAWLGERLGSACHLVHLDDPTARLVEQIRGVRPDDAVSFADGYPILLTSSASLSALNAALGAPVGMDRFRPNLVIDGAEPWQEDGWQRLRIGAMLFRAPKACTRCIVTTLDQVTGLAPVPGEPLRTLGRLSRHADGIVFGRNLIPEAPGRLRLGDAVEVLGEA